MLAAGPQYHEVLNVQVSYFPSLCPPLLSLFPLTSAVSFPIRQRFCLLLPRPNRVS